MKIDPIDLNILDILQKDAKTTNKEIGASLGLSTTAVYERVKRMERNEVITRYAAIINKQTLGLNLIAFCYVSLSSHNKSYLQDFQAQVIKLPEVSECYHIAGQYDYMLKVTVKNMEAYRDFIVDKLTILEHISSTQTVFVMDELKNETSIELIRKN